MSKEVHQDQDLMTESAIIGNLTNVNKQTGTTYTVASSDCGKVVDLSNAGAITLTLPGTLPEGFTCMIVQSGAGQVTVALGGSAVLRSRQSHTKLFGQWAMATLVVRANAGGNAAEWVLQGDTA